MEMAIIVVAVILVIVWFGLLRPLEVAAQAATEEVVALHASRKAEHINKLAELQIDDEKVEAAQKSLSRLNAIKL